MLHDQVMSAINEALDSAEFRAVLAKAIYDRIAPRLPPDEDESTKDTVTGIECNFTPNGLAWTYRQKLARRPSSGEDEFTVAAHMNDLIAAGIPGTLIYDTLVKRGKSAEAIWEFKKRVQAAHKEAKPVDSPYTLIEARMNAELARRNGK